MRKILAASLFIIACTPVSVTSAPTAQPTPIASGSEFCAAADANLQKLGCIPVGKPYTLKGKSFTEFCQETLSNGIAINPQCLSTIASCSQEVTCNNPALTGK